MYKQKMNEILSKELTRQEFLKAGGVLILSILGLPALLDALQRSFSANKKLPTAKNIGTGYGDRPYGK